MSTSAEFVQYVLDQFSELPSVRTRKMFGEYGFFYGGIYFAAACDNQFFVKITEGGKRLLPDCETAPPYPGAKPMFLIPRLEDRELLTELARVTCRELPPPRSKKGRSTTNF